MSKVKDLAGQKFGELTVLADTGLRVRGGGVVWLCQCSCGNICEANSHSLQSGAVKTCGTAHNMLGRRFGRLVVVSKKESRKNGSVIWLCRCDCGNVLMANRITLCSGGVKSCGCLSSRGGVKYAKCPACGNRFPIELNGERTPQFCPECAPKYEGRNWKVCPVCGKLFPSPASAKTVTCSKECSAEWKSRAHSGLSNKWSEKSKAKKREQGQTDNLKLGTPAAMASPVAGRFETNQMAKVWTLIDPSGNEIVVRNLLMWARENTERFGKPEGDKSARQIESGFKAIALTLRGKRKTPAMTYFGWTLKDLPKEPGED